MTVIVEERPEAVTAEAVIRQAQDAELPHHRAAAQSANGNPESSGLASEQTQDETDRGSAATHRQVSSAPTGTATVEGSSVSSEALGPNSGQALQSSAASFSRKSLHRIEGLRAKFDLPPTETLLDDYMCALRTRLLHQGRLYVFDSHLCFTASLFNSETKASIALKDVVDVKKKKNIGFPNSIEVATSNGKRFFFTSFLARGDAYRLILSAWQQCSPAAAGVAAAAKASSASAKAGSAGKKAPAPLKPVKKLLGTVSKSMLGVGRDAGAEERETPPRSAADADAGWRSGSVALDAEDSSDESATEAPSPTGRTLPALDSSSNIHAGSDGRHATEQPEGPSAAAERSTSGLQQISAASLPEMEAVSDLQALSDVETGFSGANDAPAPPVGGDMKHVIDFELPCSPREFWARFLSNTSGFFVGFHEARGDTSIKLSPWQRHKVVGMVRDLQFVTAVKAKMGPSTALCHQTQRYQVFEREHLVFETSQVMSNIPYGDHFSVETRWDVTPSPANGGSHVSVHVKVPFSKSTIWSKMITNGVMESTLESFHIWRDTARSALEQQPDPSAALEHVREQVSIAQPKTTEDWEELIVRVDPQFREALRAMIPAGTRAARAPGGGRNLSLGRRLQRSGSSSRSTSSRDVEALGPRRTTSKDAAPSPLRSSSLAQLPPRQPAEGARLPSSEQEAPAGKHHDAVKALFGARAGAPAPSHAAHGPALLRGAVEHTRLLLLVLGLLLMLGLQLATLLELRRERASGMFGPTGGVQLGTHAMGEPVDVLAGLASQIDSLRDQLGALRSQAGAWQGQLKALEHFVAQVLTRLQQVAGERQASSG